MGLLSKFGRKKGHSRSQTSTSSITGSDFLAAASDSSHSSAESPSATTYNNNKKGSALKNSHSKASPQRLHPKKSSSSLASANPLQQWPLLQTDPSLHQKTLSAAEFSTSSTLDPTRSPHPQKQSQQPLYSPKIRKPDSSSNSQHQTARIQPSGPEPFMEAPLAQKSSAVDTKIYAKSPLSVQHSPESASSSEPLADAVNAAAIAAVASADQVLPAFSSLLLNKQQQQQQPPTIRGASTRSSFAVTGSASESDLASAYDEEDNDEDSHPSKDTLASQREFFAQNPVSAPNASTPAPVSPAASVHTPKQGHGYVFQAPQPAQSVSGTPIPHQNQLNMHQRSYSGYSVNGYYGQQQQQQPQDPLAAQHTGGGYPYYMYQQPMQMPMQMYPPQMQQYYYQQQQQVQQAQQQFQSSPSPSGHNLRRLSVVLSNLVNSYHNEDISRKSTMRSRNVTAPVAGSKKALKEEGKENIARSGLEFSLNPNQFRYISDYDKYLFDDEEPSKEAIAEMAQEASSENVAGPKKTTEGELDRKISSASESSYNSIERGDSGKFKVGSTTERLERIKSNTSKFDQMTRSSQKDTASLGSQHKRASTPNFGLYHHESKNSISSAKDMSSRRSMMDVSHFYAPPSPQIPQHYPPQQGWGNGSASGGSVYNMAVDYQGSPAMKRQTMIMLEAQRRLMYAGNNGVYQPPQPQFAPPMMMGPPPSPSAYSRSSSPQRGLHTVPHQQLRINDPNILRKIENYVQLRNVIASGNKSLEYRLKWVKMLINSTNSRLYNYINIKGEPIGNPEAIPQHRLLFIRSSVNHALKLLKESEKREEDEEIFSDVCYVYGCLLKHDFVALYGQDFNVEYDIEESLKYFERSVEVRANNFKSFYKLGELYQDEFSSTVENNTGIALDYFKKSAQYGYNKAIYRISLIYLNVDEFRSPKCIRFINDLANIDVNSKDINLEDDDRDELDHVVGMASFQMGKLYEGLYPGDLLPDSDFIMKCISMAPVNYSKALAYYNKASKLQNLDAQVKLGNVYENGELNRQLNPNKSIQWFLKAASLNIESKRHPEAMLGLSRWYLKGSDGLNRVIPYPDPQKALAWCDRAVLSKLPEAFFARGLLAEQGLGIDTADQFYQRAYELGHYEAGVKLGYNQPIQPDSLVPIDEGGDGIEGGLYDFDNQYEISSPQLSDS